MGGNRTEEMSGIELLQQLKEKSAQKKEQNKSITEQRQSHVKSARVGAGTTAMPNLSKSDKTDVETEAMPNLSKNVKVNTETAAMPYLENSDNVNIVTDVMPEINNEKSDNVRKDSWGVVYNGMQVLSQGNQRHYVVGELVSSTGGTAEIREVQCVEDEGDFVIKIYTPVDGKRKKHNRHIKEFYEKTKDKHMEGLISILDYGEIPVDGGIRHFYILPNIRTTNLGEYLDNHDMSDNEVEKFIADFSYSLNQMHDLGFFHRDIKPQNIMYNGKIPVLIDYGSITTGEIKTGNEISVTTNAMETQGYTAPEILMHLAAAVTATKRQEVIATRKTDFFSFGVVIAEIYKTMEIRKREGLYDENNNRKMTKLFTNNLNMKEQMDAGIAWSADFLQRKRMVNLVSALLKENPKYRAGYDEITAWLNGETLYVHNENKEIQFDYFFNDVQYNSPIDLALAMGKNWEAGKNEIKRNFELLKSRFKELARRSKAYKTIADSLDDIDEYYERSGYAKEDRFDAELAEILMCIGGKDIPFVWRGNFYSDEQNQTAKGKFIEEIYCDAKNDEKVFVSLVKTRAVKEVLYEDIRYIRDTSNEDVKEKVSYDGKIKNVEIINSIAEKSTRKAKYYVTEQYQKGFLIGKLSGGETMDAGEYLRNVFTTENFDAAMKDIYCGVDDSANVIMQFMNGYLQDDEITAMILAHFGISIESCVDSNLIDKASQLLMLIRDLLNVDEKLVKSGEEGLGLYYAFYDSKYNKAVKGLTNIQSFCTFEDRLGSKEALKALKKLTEHLRRMNGCEHIIRDFSSEGFFVAAKKYIDEFISVLKTIDVIRSLVVYDRELLSSGLVFVTGDNLNSSIYPSDKEHNFCLVDDKFLLPQNIAEELYASSGIKISEPGRQEKIRKLSVAGCNKCVSSFFDKFKAICGTGIEEVVNVKKYNLWIQFVLSLLVVSVGVGLMVAGCVCGTSHAFSEGLVNKRYVGFIIIIDFVLGAVLSLGCKSDLKGSIDNLCIFKQNKDLYAHFHKIQAANRIMQSMEETGKLQKLNSEQSEIVDISFDLGKVAENYCQKYHLKRGDRKYYKHHVFSTIFVGVVGVAFMMINILPAGNMTGALFANNIDYAVECGKDKDFLAEGIKVVNTCFSKLSLQMTEENIKRNLIQSFNDGKLDEGNYIEKRDKYYELCKSFNYSLNEKSKKALDNIVESKKAFVKGNQFSGSKQKKAIPYFLNVIPEDSNYNEAQKVIFKYLADLYKTQQNNIEYGNEKKIAKIVKKYQKILDGNVSNTDLKNQYYILVNYNLKEAARRLVAYQLYTNKDDWSKDIISLKCIKCSTGNYYLYVEKKSHGLHALLSSYTSSYYKVLTYKTSKVEEADVSDASKGKIENAKAKTIDSDFEVDDCLSILPE